MKKDIRLAICLVAIILLAILCVYRLLADKENEEEINTEGYENQAIPTPKVITVDGKELVEISYYTVNLMKMSRERAEGYIGSTDEIKPETIVEFICDALEDEELNVKVRNISISDKVCYIDLDDEIESISEMDSRVEKLILDAFSISILDNCWNVDAVSFTIMGKEYSTENIKIESDKTYIKR